MKPVEMSPCYSSLHQQIWSKISLSLPTAKATTTTVITVIRVRINMIMIVDMLMAIGVARNGQAGPLPERGVLRRGLEQSSTATRLNSETSVESMPEGPNYPDMRYSCFLLGGSWDFVTTVTGLVTRLIVSPTGLIELGPFIGRVISPATSSY